MKLPSIEEMLKAGMHFGHRTSRWHPGMKPYIFGDRKGIYIIDLEKSRKMLEHALEFITRSTANNKRILLVGTKSQVSGLLKKVAKDTGMPFVSEKWIGGLLTNFSVIKKTIKKYKDLLEKKESGQLTKYTKKEQLQFDRQIAKLDLSVGGVANLMNVPELIFIWDIKTEKTALAEANKKNITVIAVCDTNVNPKNVDYVIPANDDASKSIKMILGLVKEAILEGKEQAMKHQTFVEKNKK
ncbi:MAG: 30S ribosomal protein S2 [bacterium]